MLKDDALRIVNESVRAVLPDEAVWRALSGFRPGGGRLLLVSAGKAAWRMSAVATEVLGDRLEAGVCVTKYGYAQGEIRNVKCFEAGHPVPDENSFAATSAALDLVSGLKPDDTVLFLLSGGGSSLFEKPLIPAAELMEINEQLLASGADITEINTIRKRLSAVKGGRFARICEPARVFNVILSDVPGNRPDMIASGPACPDSSTSAQALDIIEKYGLKMSDAALELIKTEAPKTLSNTETIVSGSVSELCRAASTSCRRLGYTPLILTDSLSCEAAEAGRRLSDLASLHSGTEQSLAFIAGGETVVRLKGNGRGGRCQEAALSAARGIAGLKDTAVFCFGSDGTDGPTDAAGGYADGHTKELLDKEGIDIDEVLLENDSYNALKRTGGLIFTGPTGTNVNDLYAVLIKR